MLNPHVFRAYDVRGLVGSDINLLFRMLNARPLKRALTSSSAELALIISEYLYHNIVCRYPSLVSPDAFQQVRFQDQHISTQAWAYLPASELQRAKHQATPTASSPDP